MKLSSAELATLVEYFELLAAIELHDTTSKN